MAQLELEKLKVQAGMTVPSEEETQNLGWSTSIKMVPKFKETDLAEYYTSFEKLMKMVSSPAENWTLLLQSAVTGKPLKAYSCLSDEDSRNYVKVEGAVLKAYKLLPEAYRVKFRELWKESTASYLEFARAK